MHGIPASLMITTFLVSRNILTMLNILVYEYVFNGISTPRPFFILVFLICSSMCSRSDESIPYSSSNSSYFYFFIKSFSFYSILTARYLRKSILNFCCYYLLIFLKNFLLCFSLKFAYS
jgi:hypothetical protein